MGYSTMDHFLLVLFSMVAAFLPRLIPLRIFATRKIPNWFNEWMKYVPVSLFTALVVKDMFMNTSNYTFVGASNVAKIIAAIIVIGVAYKTRSMGLSVVVGLVAVMILSMFVAV
ncbi:AzlD domain-containing protein [Ligilactobacillus sp. WILCCON 0076]|uniref:AzlD domain-containing protein n=1 Tax=Ligilactobacillus ubinensis TaxID=2876789 RepID=A0A9X2FKV4_9LACO|nr:AzlD domain-containing protein [Ligilactobacillus ubinensis]MCP0887225.1 AzlD domain-containing protein [Ligilactobacillus ubinensis]